MRQLLFLNVSIAFFCAFNAKLHARTKAARDPLAQLEPPCKVPLVRKGLANYDRGMLWSDAERYYKVFSANCGCKTKPAGLQALANDMAIIYFHKGDDKACLDLLVEAGAKAKPSAQLGKMMEFNAALCGAPADGMDEAVAKKASDAREAALAKREVWRKRREVNDAHCERDTKGDRRIQWRVAPNLKKGDDRRGDQEWPVTPNQLLFYAVSVTADLNGDGLGDLVDLGAAYVNCGGDDYRKVWYDEPVFRVEVRDFEGDGILEICWWDVEHPKETPMEGIESDSSPMCKALKEGRRYDF